MMSKPKLEILTYKNEHLIHAISLLYDMAMSGEITGACFVVKHNRKKHTVGVTGTYRNNPDCAIRPLRQLEKMVEKLGDDIEVYKDFDHPEMAGD